eukprot:bmy_16128T0
MRRPPGRSWDDRKWFETSDENTVGTFSNSGFEDDRTNENFYVALENMDTNMTVRGQGGVMVRSAPRSSSRCPPSQARGRAGTRRR